MTSFSSYQGKYSDRVDGKSNNDDEVSTDITMDGDEQVSTHAPPARNGPRSIGTIGLALVVFAFVAFFATSSKNNAASSALKGSSKQEQEATFVDLEGSSKVTACTFEECYESNCNWKVAPFTCLFMNGGPHGGCSSTPWMVPQTCTTQCDLSQCGKVETPKDATSCDHACDPEWCNGSGERLCGSSASYQCVEGSSAFGCSADKFQWSFKSSVATCSKCCNAKKCS